jgi:hypothetical protein
MNNVSNKTFGGNTLQNNLVSSDPLFVNASAGNFQLQASSPAIDFGIPISGITDGYAGSAPDAGAYEYGTAAWAAGASVAALNSTTSSGTDCHIWDSLQTVPAGFGAAFNLFSGDRELLMKAFCNSNSLSPMGFYVDYQVGNGSNHQYIYNQGYYWTGTQWSPYTYRCSDLVSGVWCVGNANYTRAITSQELRTKQSYIAHICDWNGSAWKCGCNDTACITDYWNLQQFKQW